MSVSYRVTNDDWGLLIERETDGRFERLSMVWLSRLRGYDPVMAAAELVLYHALRYHPLRPQVRTLALRLAPLVTEALNQPLGYWSLGHDELLMWCEQTEL